MLSRPRLKHLLLEASTPPARRLVALFHGLGGGLGELRHVAERWSAALPSTAFLLLEAPDRDYYARELLSGQWSGDWYRYPMLRSEFGEDEEAYSRMAERCISERCDHVSAELDDHLAVLGLENEQLVLAGFSQGAAVSAYTGLRRGCLGVLPLGGPCPPRPNLMPENSVTRVCCVVGDADPFAPHEEIRRCFAMYPPRDAASGVHVIAGQSHVVSEQSIRIGLRFLSESCGCT